MYQLSSLSCQISFSGITRVFIISLLDKLVQGQVGDSKATKGGAACIEETEGDAWTLLQALSVLRESCPKQEEIIYNPENGDTWDKGNTPSEHEWDWHALSSYHCPESVSQRWKLPTFTAEVG